MIAEHIEDRTARGIAVTVSRLITSGAIEPGTRLPTVRALAAEIGVSPTTVSQAWRRLAEAGVIEPRGKLGTIVRDREASPGSGRFVRLRHMGSDFRLDLSAGVPDHSLLPDLRPALASIATPDGPPLTNSYHEDPVLPALREHLMAALPSEPESLTVVSGALDGLERAFEATIQFGDRVLVEEFTFPPILDLLERRGARPVALRMDQHGVVPQALREALALKPSALVIQPRAQNPTGRSMTPTRERELARVLKGTHLTVIEDDHVGDIATSAAVSLGRHLPAQTLHVRSFSKSHGPDLRLAALSGPSALIDHIVTRRQIGAGWSSRILQTVLLHLLTDATAKEQVLAAREIYAERRTLLTKALTDRGVTVSGADGINLWIEVHDEQTAMLKLSASGVLVAPGGPFAVEKGQGEYIRVTCGVVRSDWDDLAEVLAHAAAVPTDGTYR